MSVEKFFSTILIPLGRTHLETTQRNNVRLARDTVPQRTIPAHGQSLIEQR